MCLSLGNGDTLVQYAACLLVPSRGEPVAQFDSDYSGGEGASIYYSCRYVDISSLFPLGLGWKGLDLGYY